jgi:hypothetical protein
MFPSSGEMRETPTPLGPLVELTSNTGPVTSGEVRETPALLGPLGRSNLNHWTSFLG